jgi:hypothetical protein
MKAGHLTQEEIGQYWQRTLPPAALLAADDHLTQCEDCRKLVGRTGRTVVGAAALRDALAGAEPAGSSHLSYEDLVAFAEDDWKTADRQQVIQHLGHCKACSEEAEDLRRFRPGPSFRAETGESRTTNLTATIAVRRSSWRVPVWAGAAAVLLLAIFLSFRAYRSGIQPQPALVVQLNDAGGSIHLDSSGRLVTPSPLDSGDTAQMKDALLRQRIEPSAAIAQLIEPQGTLLSWGGTPTGLQLVAPLGTVVPSNRPDFRWQPLSSATYIVSIYDAHYKKMAESPPVRQTEWRPDHPLPRGQIYTWQLTALLKGKHVHVPLPPAQEARFQVLSEAEAAQLQKAQQEHPNSHLLMGILYARAGALDDSERELSALLAANPDSGVARQLLASVQQFRRNKGGNSGGSGNYKPSPIKTEPAQ